LRFSVADTGRGIAPDRLPRIFEPAPSPASGAGRGAGPGFGLFLARRLAERMGGVCGVDSRVGMGSTFWFTARLEARAVPESVDAPADLRGARVLVLDD